MSSWKRPPARAAGAVHRTCFRFRAVFKNCSRPLRSARFHVGSNRRAKRMDRGHRLAIAVIGPPRRHFLDLGRQRLQKLLLRRETRFLRFEPTALRQHDVAQRIQNIMHRVRRPREVADLTAQPMAVRGHVQQPGDSRPDFFQPPPHLVAVTVAFEPCPNATISLPTRRNILGKSPRIRIDVPSWEMSCPSVT